MTSKDFRINYAFCESYHSIGRVYKCSHVNNLISQFYIVDNHQELKHLKKIADHELIKTMSKDKQAIIYSTNVSSIEATSRLEKDEIRGTQKLSDYLSLVHYNNQYAQHYCSTIIEQLYIFNYQLDPIHVFDSKLNVINN